MPVGRFLGFPSIQLLRVALFGAALAAGLVRASAETVQVRYRVSLIGLPLGTAEARANLDQSHYSIEAEAKLTGIAALVARSKGSATASGAIRNGRLAPADYATTSANANMTRTIRMAMNAGTVMAVKISPPFDALPGRIPVTPALRRNIVDPLSALLMTVPANEPLVGPAACNRRIPIFDGYTRFDITLSYVRSQMLRTRGYRGPVSVCAARYVPIAGHRPGGPATKFMAENRHLQVWLAPLSEVRVELPVRISILTLFGTTVLQATDIRHGAPFVLTSAENRRRRALDKRVDRSPSGAHRR